MSRRNLSSGNHHRWFVLWRKIILFLILITTLSNPTSRGRSYNDIGRRSNAYVTAWEWNDIITYGNDMLYPEELDVSTTNILSIEDVSSMRVRDIKRRLTRTHGYSAEELNKMLDKKELIHALRYEEHKEELKRIDIAKRALFWRAVWFTIIAIIIVAGWPVWTHLWEVGHVNFVVYTDRKKHEFSRCIELKSFYGMIGIILMGIVDLISFWLSISVLLSWIMSQRSKYMFPTPNLSIRPAQFMGQQVANGPLSKYGLNIGPMIITWILRFTANKLEIWTGKALSNSYNKRRQEHKQKQREIETPEERAIRKAAKKAAKKKAKEEAKLAEERLQQQAIYRQQQQQKQQEQYSKFQNAVNKTYEEQEKERQRLYMKQMGKEQAMQFGMVNNNDDAMIDNNNNDTYDNEDESNYDTTNGETTTTTMNDTTTTTSEGGLSSEEDARRKQFQEQVCDFDDLD